MVANAKCGYKNREIVRNLATSELGQLPGGNGIEFNGAPRCFLGDSTNSKRSPFSEARNIGFGSSIQAIKHFLSLTRSLWGSARGEKCSRRMR